MGAHVFIGALSGLPGLAPPGVPIHGEDGVSSTATSLLE